MNKTLKKLLYRIIVAAIIFVVALFLPKIWSLQVALFILSYIVVGGSIVWKALRNIKNGQVFDENFLMTIATFGAFALGDYAEAIAVMLFFQVGELFQGYAVNQSRKSIADLMDIRPDYARVERNGACEIIDPEEVLVGETIVIQPGERIPLDGVVLSGFSSVDTAALSGESMPRETASNDEVISGCINLTGVLKVRVIKEFANSTVAKILDLVENASTKKANIENFITRFARYYTPIVVIIALLLAFIPPLLVGGASFHDWAYRAITFLVISCPCALVISIPLSFFGGLGAASRSGILIKGSNYLEALAKAQYVVFDKTGTLTKGCFSVVEIKPQGVSKEKLMELAAYAEAYSSHPIGQSIKKAYALDLDLERVKNVQEIHGLGLQAEVDGLLIEAGNEKMLQKLGISLVDNINENGTIIYVVANGKYIGYIRIADEIKEDAVLAIRLLKELGVQKTVMLTGDRHACGVDIAKQVGLDEVYSQLLPADKVCKVEELLEEKDASARLLFVGDGINDAPVLARADVGVAMGGIGSDAAIEAADVVIMNDEPSKLVLAIKIARQTLRIAKQNIVFAIGVKLIVLALGACGMVSIWAAVFADVGVSVIAILNAIRVLVYRVEC